MVFVMEMCVFCEVGIDLLSVVDINMRLSDRWLAVSVRKVLRPAVWKSPLHANGCKQMFSWFLVSNLPLHAAGAAPHPQP